MELYETYGDDIQFYLVYIREAHAIDSAMPMGGNGMPIVEDPVSQEERNAVATVCTAKLELGDMPTLVDDMADTANSAYSGWPDRLYLIGLGGKITYQGGPGPFGFSPDELDAAIRAELGLTEDEPEAEAAEESEDAAEGEEAADAVEDSPEESSDQSGE